MALWWDGLQLDSREDWNEDWAIVDGAGYHDIQVGLSRGGCEADCDDDGEGAGAGGR